MSIENALAGIPGLEMTRSLSRNGFSQVTAIFDDKVDIYFARQQINERLAEAKEYFPERLSLKWALSRRAWAKFTCGRVEYKHPDGKGAKSGKETRVAERRLLFDI